MEAPSAERVIPLHSPGSRELLAHRVIFGLLWLVGLLFVAGGVSAVLEETAGTGQLLLGLAVIAISEAGRRLHQRDVAPGERSIRGAEVIIADPQLLKRPLVVALQNIRVAALDLESETSDRGLGRFPVYGDDDGPLAGRIRGYLTPGKSRAPLRSLRRSAYEPNFVLLFEQPVLVEELRRQVEHGPENREALGGLALFTRDPDAAREAFAALRVNDRITEQDAEHLWFINSGEAVPQEEGAVSFARAERRKARTAGWSAVVGGLLLPPLEIGGLVIAYGIWREGLRAQPIAMATCALVLLGFHVWVLTQPPTREWWRFALGVPATIIFLVIWIRWLARGDAADPHEGLSTGPRGAG